MDREFLRCGPGDRVGDLLSGLGEHAVCAVVDEDGILLGRFRKAEAEENRDALARDLMTVGASTFRPDVHAAEMADWFKKRPKADHFFITTPNGVVFGVLYRSVVEHIVEHAASRIDVSPA